METLQLGYQTDLSRGSEAPHPGWRSHWATKHSRRLQISGGTGAAGPDSQPTKRIRRSDETGAAGPDSHPGRVDLKSLPAWTSSLPQRLRQRLLYERSEVYGLPKEPFALILYAGIDDATSLEAAVHSINPYLCTQIFALDTKRSPLHDMLQPNLWNSLCTAAITGKIWAVVGGPNCKTWSIRRHFRKPLGQPQAYPVRGRSEPECWGLPNISDAAQSEVDDDSILLLRQMLLTSLMHEHCSWSTHLLEHPADPSICCSHPAADRCSSIWVTQVMADWSRSVRGSTITFDQCRMGQLVPKTTTVHTDMELEWNGLRCNHNGHKAEITDSAELSRWPWGMMLDIAKQLAPEGVQV